MEGWLEKVVETFRQHDGMVFSPDGFRDDVRRLAGRTLEGYSGLISIHSEENCRFERIEEGSG